MPNSTDLLERSGTSWMCCRTGVLNRLTVVSMATWLLLCWVVVPIADGKKRRSSRSLPLKIVEVTVSPSPFEVGKGELNLSIVVELPRKLNGANLLEFTALISSPSRSSMSFLTQRLPLSIEPNPQENSHVYTTLFWDGKDQAEELVSSGTYLYEVRVKLMAEEGDGPRTKIESPRSHGTVEVVNAQDNE